MIQKVVSEYYGQPVSLSQKHSRVGDSLHIRQRIHYFCREFLPKCPLHVIGLLTGNGQAFDHATIHHGAKRLTMELTLTNRAGAYVYPETVKEIAELREKIALAISDSRKGIVNRCPHCGSVLI
jgi:chromosomal replication initiation ATPase DnaA